MLLTTNVVVGETILLARTKGHVDAGVRHDRASWRFRVPGRFRAAYFASTLARSDSAAAASCSLTAVRTGQDHRQHRRALRSVWRADQVSRDPAVGLRLGGERRVEQYDPIALAALSARSFRDALGRLARYKQLV